MIRDLTSSTRSLGGKWGSRRSLGLDSRKDAGRVVERGVMYTYDSVGNLTQSLDATGQNYFSFDDLNRVTTKATLAGAVYYSYDRTSRKTKVTAPNLTGAYYAYDATGRLIQVTAFDRYNGGALRPAYLAYDPSSLLTTKCLYENNVCSYYTYDNAARLATLSNLNSSSTVINYFSYGRDPDGNITYLTRENNLNIYYGFDPLDRLIREEWKSGSTMIYGYLYNYDAASNRYFKHDEVLNTTAYWAYDPTNTLQQEWDLP
jgi:RHS Repeat